VILSSDGPIQSVACSTSGQWATRYEYNVYFSNSNVQGGQVTYNATAVAGSDLSAVAGTVGQTVETGVGSLLGELYDCSNIRLSGATVETGSVQSHTGPLFYFTADESNPLPSLSAVDTSDLSLFGALNLATGSSIRVTAIGQCPPNAASANPSICKAGDDVMLGTYVVQVYPGAMTAILMQGRLPWQP